MQSQIKHNYFNMNKPLKIRNSELKLIISMNNFMPKQFSIKYSISPLYLHMTTLNFFHSP